MFGEDHTFADIGMDQTINSFGHPNRGFPDGGNIQVFKVIRRKLRISDMDHIITE